MKNNYSNLRIKDIEKNAGINYLLNEDINKYALPKWYDGIRNKKIYELNDNDIAICIRQNIFWEHIMPEVLARLAKDPTIGSKYYGEVLTALYRLEDSIWISNTDLLNNIQIILVEINEHKLIPLDFEWMYSEQENEFYEMTKQFSEKLSNIKKGCPVK